ncbi:MAG: hypothetical protein ACOCUV_01770 [bacterium]
MTKNEFKDGVRFAIFTGLAIIAVIISIVTYQFSHLASSNILFKFLINNHIWIMILTMLFSIGYGFIVAQILSNKVEKTKKNSKELLETIMLFLGEEEKHVIYHLIENKGKSTQSKIAHVKNMGNVKALRTVQKLADKQLIEVNKEGKMRKVTLKDNIKEMLK